MAAHGGGGGGAWCAVPVRSRRAAPSATAAHHGGGGDDHLPGLGDFAEGAVGLESIAGVKRIAMYGCLVEGSGEGAPAPADGSDAAGHAEAAHQDARCGHGTAAAPYATPIAMAYTDLMACEQTGSGKTAALCVPFVSGSVAAAVQQGGGGYGRRGSSDRAAS